jgi:hypothetical protein
VEAVTLKANSVAAIAEKAIVGSGRVVSVPRLVRELRRCVPDCEHTDEELAHLVAVIAIAQGRTLSFLRGDVLSG